MKLDLKGVRVIKCDFHNEMTPNMKLNLQVNINNQIKLPKELREKAAGTVTTKVMVGSPMHPLFLYMEQVCTFADSEPPAGEPLDTDSLMSLYKTICIPVAVKEIEGRMQSLGKLYGFPEIKVAGKKANAERNPSSYLN